MKFLVTGGAGFIGHNVVQQLESQGHECVIFDCITDYKFVPLMELKYLFRERNKSIHGHVHRVDITNHANTDLFFSKYAADADVVIHLASFPRQKVVNHDPVRGADVMCTALIGLMELTAKYRIPKFVYISSSMVYGDFQNDVTEDATCDPQGQYGIMKYMGEKLVQDYARRGCFQHVIVRPSAVYGPMDVEDRVISKFMLSALRGHDLHVKGANEVLDFTYVTDTAQGIALSATVTEAVGNIFNITRSDSTLCTLQQVAEKIVKLTNRGQVIIQERDQSFPSRGRLSIQKARTLLGYNPTTDIDQGLSDYHDWFHRSTYWHYRIR